MMATARRSSSPCSPSGMALSLNGPNESPAGVTRLR
jgi:hypothetical protein